MRWSSLIEMTGDDNSAADAASRYKCTDSTCIGSTAAFMVHIIHMYRYCCMYRYSMYVKSSEYRSIG